MLFILQRKRAYCLQLDWEYASPGLGVGKGCGGGLGLGTLDFAGLKEWYPTNEIKLSLALEVSPKYISFLSAKHSPLALSYLTTSLHSCSLPYYSRRPCGFRLQSHRPGALISNKSPESQLAAGQVASFSTAKFSSNILKVSVLIGHIIILENDRAEVAVQCLGFTSSDCFVDSLSRPFIEASCLFLAVLPDSNPQNSHTLVGTLIGKGERENLQI